MNFGKINVIKFNFISINFSKINFIYKRLPKLITFLCEGHQLFPVAAVLSSLTSLAVLKTFLLLTHSNKF